MIYANALLAGRRADRGRDNRQWASLRLKSRTGSSRGPQPKPRRLSMTGRKSVNIAKQNARSNLLPDGVIAKRSCLA